MKSKHSNSKKPLLPFISLFLNPGNQRNQDDSSIDWNADIPVITIPPLCVPPARVYILLFCVSLPQMDTSGNNRSEPSSFDPVLLNYDNSQPLDSSS